jgi:hypothetical protein
MLNKGLLVSVLTLSALLLTSCSAVKSITSEAYAAGLSTGQEYAALQETADNLQSWVPEEEGSQNEPLIKGDKASVKAYCSGIWAIVGISSGLENSESNRSDFVSGCLEGAGF